MQRFSEEITRHIGLACRAFGWSPAMVWNATPSELQMAFSPIADVSTLPPSRDQITQMMERDYNG